MKTIILLVALVTVCFSDNDFITTENLFLWDDLVYRGEAPKALYTTPAENNDTTYTVVRKESEYLIIREYKVVDTVKVKVVK